MTYRVTLGSTKSFDGFESIYLNITRTPVKGELLYIVGTGKFHGIFLVKQVCHGDQRDVYLWLSRAAWDLKSYDEIIAARKADKS